MKKGAQSCWST